MTQHVIHDDNGSDVCVFVCVCLCVCVCARIVLPQGNATELIRTKANIQLHYLHF